MVNIAKFTVEWTGFTGAPGYTNIFALGIDTVALANSFAASLRSFLDTSSATFPAGLTHRIQAAVPILWDESGALVDTMALSAVPAPVVGNGAGAYAGGAGLCISWLTGVVDDGRAIAGKTYLVPMVAIYDTDGTLNTANLNAWSASANTFRTAQAGKLAVWRRPRKPDLARLPPRLARDGRAVPVTGSFIKDRSALLRSRRD